MMEAANRDRELVADLSAQRAGLGKAQMMRFGGRAATDDARVFGDKFAVLLVAQANGLAGDAASSGRDFLNSDRRTFRAIKAISAVSVRMERLRPIRGSDGFS